MLARLFKPGFAFGWRRCSSRLSIRSFSCHNRRTSAFRIAFDSVAAMGKRKSSSMIAESLPQIPAAPHEIVPPPAKRRASARAVPPPKLAQQSTNPDENPDILDAPEALRASPDATSADERMDVEKAGMNAEKQIKGEKKAVKASKTGKGKKSAEPSIKEEDAESTAVTPATKAQSKDIQFFDPDAEEDGEADEAELQAALSRPPPVNSDFLPLPWKGRIGYVSCVSIIFTATANSLRLV